MTALRPSPSVVPVAAPSRLVLDARAWALLVRACAVPGLPSAMAPGAWAAAPAREPGSDDATAQEAQEAWQRLAAAGVVVRHDGGSTDGRGSVTVHPGVLSALAAVVAGPVRVSVRSWTGDREVLVELGVVAGRAAGLARRRVLDGQHRPVADEPWVELSELDAGDVVDEVVRALPAVLDSLGPPTGPSSPSAAGSAAVPEVGLSVDGSLALVAALRTGRADLVAAVAAVGEVTADAADDADDVPDVVADVAERVRGGVDVEVRVVTVAGDVVARWVGVWLLTAFGPVAIRPASVDEHGGMSSVRLERVDAEGLRADVESALVAAVETAAAPGSAAALAARGTGGGAGG